MSDDQKKQPVHAVIGVICDALSNLSAEEQVRAIHGVMIALGIDVPPVMRPIQPPVTIPIAPSVAPQQIPALFRQLVEQFPMYTPFPMGPTATIHS